MIHNQAQKTQLCIDAVSATNGATITSQLIDTLGFDQCSLTIWSTTSNAATNIPAVTLQESDDTVATNFAAITAGTSGTNAGNFTYPAYTATSQNPSARLNINTQYRKRYLRLTVVPVTTQTYYSLAELTRAGQMPKDATTGGVGVLQNL